MVRIRGGTEPAPRRKVAAFSPRGPTTGDTSDEVGRVEMTRDPGTVGLLGDIVSTVEQDDPRIGATGVEWCARRYVAVTVAGWAGDRACDAGRRLDLLRRGGLVRTPGRIGRAGVVPTLDGWHIGLGRTIHGVGIARLLIGGFVPARRIIPAVGRGCRLLVRLLAPASRDVRMTAGVWPRRRGARIRRIPRVDRNTRVRARRTRRRCDGRNGRDG
ncbi:hypothetical protein FRAHR75_250009 [Frankia sp. Hr75.2]|nr:hypothetical protein FRAHR75_250009 [Frankia sp. Hr75.2]